MTHLLLLSLMLTGGCCGSGDAGPMSAIRVGAHDLSSASPEKKCCGCCGQHAYAMQGDGSVIGQVRKAPMPPTPSERGFHPIFDGKTTKGWAGYKMDHFPKSWGVKDGELTCTPGTEDVDLRTTDEYGDFELRLDYKIAPGGNSGIMYRCTEEHEASWNSGTEYQLLDDAGSNIASDSVNSTGAAYDFYGPKNKVVHPAGEWNSVQIVCKGKHVEHWMNGIKIVDYEIGTPEWTDIYKKSKFAVYPDFGTHPKGYIALQDHGNVVSFRNIRIKKL